MLVLLANYAILSLLFDYIIIPTLHYTVCSDPPVQFPILLFHPVLKESVPIYNSNFLI